MAPERAELLESTGLACASIGDENKLAMMVHEPKIAASFFTSGAFRKLWEWLVN
ncbi:hypothetical protein QP937_03315 [Corynebacterium pseudodiphtheriticum]|uniref:hypothetical protein n=1 Tax=Corynebacterium pseudodiphtheriticum TaxID=37637 RepID=UPI00254AEB64|nr:hypothetical protein [Corynebacterium pseudodiphtheriticum]MDK8486398.1 hypothetical protein [Corynebacterium pseudodiphtheriticum]MDK8493455.1 hypothetical protein [Corynebacterium pseudodiphtheriticum]